MPDLSAHYERMYSDAHASIAAGKYVLDPMIDDVADNRFGISLNMKLPHEVCDNILAVQHEFKSIEPEQYYYPRTDLHITVIAIVSCHSGFTIAEGDIKPYSEIIERSIREVPAFRIVCAGITASSEGVLLQGFPSGGELDQFRNELRTQFKASGLFHTIDTRYAITTVHSTMIRFRRPMRSPGAMASKLASLRNYSFGTLEADHVELVYGDWYQRAGRTRLLQKFNFKKFIPL
jgi:2'-5' RNA ligase